MQRPTLPLLVLLASLAPALDASAQQPAAAATASAQTTASAAPDDADRLFREGNELYKQKRFADAEALFEKAFAKKPAHDIAANLGYAEMNQNKLVEAAEHLAYAVRIWPPTGKDDKRQGAADRLAKVKAEIATLTIEVNVPGARVTIGEREVGTSPVTGEVFAEAGRLVVRAKREGYVDVERSVDVAKGSAQTVTIAMVASPVSLPTATASATVPVVAPRSMVPAYVIGGVGIAAAAVGASLLGGYAGKRDEAAELYKTILDGKHSCVAGAANLDARCKDLASISHAGDDLNHDRHRLAVIGGGALDRPWAARCIGCGRSLAG